MKELPDDPMYVSGYFTNSFLPKNLILHTPNEDWTGITEDNKLMATDKVLGFGLPQPWSAGDLAWSIPAVWHVVTTSQSNSLPWNDQSFEIYANGDFTISKFGHSITRGTNNLYTATNSITE